MKKILSLLTVTALIAVMLTACGSKTEEKPAETTPQTTTEAATDTVKTGLGVTTSLDGSANAAAGTDGIAKAASTVVAVTVDAQGVIDKIVIDQIQSTVNFDTTGAITSDITAAVQSKNDLGANYGMAKKSGIGKEWNEQIAAFAAYCEGKTIDQIMGIAFNAEGAPTDTDLASSVTVSVNYMTYAIKAAVENAQDLGAKKGDKLGLAVSGSLAKSAAATKDAAGLAQGYYNFAAVTTDASGVITSCILNAVQANVNFDTTGAITTDLTAAPKTKVELGDAYGMKKASSIGKEWYEEAQAFSTYVVGKTAEQVKGIAVDSDSKATDADLKASVTVSIGGFMALVAKAAA